MKSVPKRPDGKRRAADRPLTDAERRADALLAQIPDDELDALARSLARVLISAAKNRGKPQRAAPKAPSRLAKRKADWQAEAEQDGEAER